MLSLIAGDTVAGIPTDIVSAHCSVEARDGKAFVYVSFTVCTRVPFRTEAGKATGLVLAAAAMYTEMRVTLTGSQFTYGSRVPHGAIASKAEVSCST